MTITLWQLFIFIAAVVVFIATPGPGVFATIAKAMTDGTWSVLPFAMGLAAGDAIYMIFSVYGLSAVATNFHTLFVAIKFIGAAYLFYLAWHMWVSVPPPIENAGEIKKLSKKDGFAAIISGFLISISNPKVILFYISLLPSFFPVASLGMIDIAIVCAVIFIVAVVLMMAYAAMASYAQQRLRSPASRQQFNRVGASLMGAAGAWLLAKG